ncbi:hypothetical protein BCR33DRAFT_781241 [Rhizoclosmatium globosum]|uniref:Uncharacterized protein n=1 Tax=Rhizoclosmatium globosum TaxID=329046 RepID=A0A1Y2CUM2_9FUNG|nr:hypothetical protein BCR33DRAFT_781241 [Rhizoclosmatium globosum]|eukprot:ORY50534.1 hypothetical protein BCR33DRAFT_781241 [Rhizoclosmatium globosum]
MAQNGSLAAVDPDLISTLEKTAIPDSDDIAVPLIIIIEIVAVTTILRLLYTLYITKAPLSKAVCLLLAGLLFQVAYLASNAYSISNELSDYNDSLSAIFLVFTATAYLWYQWLRCSEVLTLVYSPIVIRIFKGILIMFSLDCIAVPVFYALRHKENNAVEVIHIVLNLVK